MKIRKDQLFVVTTSDDDNFYYYVSFVCRALQDFDPKVERNLFDYVSFVRPAMGDFDPEVKGDLSDKKFPTPGGQIYPTSEFIDWLKEKGVCEELEFCEWHFPLATGDFWIQTSDGNWENC